MRTLSFLLVLGLLAAGCAPGKTPEEIEAAKYPKVEALSGERAQRAAELGKSRPPEGANLNGSR